MADEEKTEKTPDVRYSVEELIERARELTGCSRHEVVGALHGDDRKTLSASQAKAAVRTFRSREAAHS